MVLLLLFVLRTFDLPKVPYLPYIGKVFVPKVLLQGGKLGFASRLDNTQIPTGGESPLYIILVRYIFNASQVLTFYCSMV